MLVVYCVSAYFFSGMFLGLVVGELKRFEGTNVSAEALTAITMFWPFAVPDVLIRLLSGRWFAEWEAGVPRRNSDSPSRHQRRG